MGDRGGGNEEGSSDTAAQSHNRASTGDVVKLDWLQLHARVRVCVWRGVCARV